MFGLINDSMKLINDINGKTYNIIRFSLYVILILASHMSSAFLVEKM